MARRIPLPRLTQRQRTARWQRERRQQAVIVVLFSAVLLSVLVLVAWSRADRYYRDNLRTAAEVGGRVIPWRDYALELKYELTQFYVQFGVPPEFENDPQIRPQKAQYDGIALSAVVEQALLNGEARAAKLAPTAQAVDERFAADNGQFRSRHVLVSPDKDATDKDAADKVALAKATAIAHQLRAAPQDDALWKTIAAESSSDPGSKDQGGELGWVSPGQFVKEFESAIHALKLYEISEPVKSAFGYHVIQLEELRGPEFSDFVKRLDAAGLGAGVAKEHARYAILKDEFRTRAQAQAVVSPTAQVRVAKIVVNTPLPTSGDFQAFTEALKKLSTVTGELEKGTDFAEVAKQYSDDVTAEKGGDLGWIARGTLGDYRAEQELFTLDAGKVSTQHSASSATTIYKVLEQDPARALTDDQREQIKSQAYDYWLAKLKQERGVRKLVPGHELE